MLNYFRDRKTMPGSLAKIQKIATEHLPNECKYDVLSQRIDHVSETFEDGITHVENMHKQSKDSIEAALKLQAFENERRMVEVTALFEREIGHLRVELSQERVLTNKALDLQTKQNEIHFTALNGEAGKLHSMQATYIPREVFEEFRKNTEAAIQRNRDSFLEDAKKAKEAVDGEFMKIRELNLQPAKAWQDMQTGKSGVTGLITSAIISIVVALIIGLIMMYIRK